MAGNRVAYYVSLHEISGLSEDVRPGDSLEIWVAWDPPLVNSPQVRRLLNDVPVDAVLAPSHPDGSAHLRLAIRKSDLVDLIYADRYGALSAAVRSPS